MSARQGEPAVPGARTEHASRVSDFTYVATWKGFTYVAFVIDAYARRLSAGASAPQPMRVSCSVPWSRRCRIGVRARAWGSSTIGVEHGARNILSIRYSERLAEAGIEPSVGSVGDSYEFKPVRQRTG